jgi:hypothetical protein
MYKLSSIINVTYTIETPVLSQYLKALLKLWKVNVQYCSHMTHVEKGMLNESVDD